MELKAVRNLRLCTKDCLCLYVCPYGATDTENSIIDINKCVGCGKCLSVCPGNLLKKGEDGKGVFLGGVVAEVFAFGLSFVVPSADDDGGVGAAAFAAHFVDAAVAIG